ncbi:Gfo/Idh/MocA family oxidoreductase [Kribbella sandramycini]|uniref:Gfo/Idh/MocA family oxidoreductase n=1 Tax=Kribbella sandramycini TaxID=60450 RepID=A0A7Y4KY61_9ACTN|nr:Gfo/Idh/MocA family oxidoreductase [Kribbella sandramycini]MBB6569323.1 putative dehydrogenase [Kribbella sandramycini]NOL40838.1 Gfo/Idh/MocA family oxidoreductase [Kribbella sandramycini]
MADTTQQVAIVGCGIIGRTHADTIAERPDATVTALVDSDPAAREALAARLKEAGQPEPTQYDDLSAALGGGQVSLVAICTPSGTHAALAEQALDAKKHVVIEKPLDVELTRARRLGAAATRAANHGVISSVISQHRFDAGSAQVKQAIDAGRFGQLTSATASVAWWRSDEYYASAGWRGTWEQDGGGALMNQGVHTVDLLLWFMGRPVSIYAQAIRAAHHAIQVEDTVVATLTFENGSIATLHATTAAFPGGRTRVSVHGTEGGAEVEDDLLARFNADGQKDDQSIDAGPPGGHKAQYDDIFAAIANNEQPGITVNHAIDALATVRAVYIASTLQRPVKFVDVLEGRYDDIDVSRGIGLPPS